MLRSIDELIGFTIRATDGDIGKVDDFYFDDHTWTIRYLVVETGNWLSQHKVLLTPEALDKPLWSEEIMPVHLTKDEVENSPNIDLEKPVSRQYEMDLHEYYGWAPYWAPASHTLAMPTGYAPAAYNPIDPTVPPRVSTRGAGASVAQEVEARAEQEEVDPHLRSVREVMGYDIQARDGEIGHVEDFIIDDERWLVQYMAVDTRDWLPGKKVIVALEWIKDIDWLERDVMMDLKRETIKNSPEYDASRPLSRDYEATLYDHYGRSGYWQTEKNL